MQVRPADARTRDAHNRVARIHNLWVLHGLHAHFLGAHPTNCLHDALLSAATRSPASYSDGLRCSGYTLWIVDTTAERGPCGCPSVVGISCISISALNRRRSSRIVDSGSFPKIANAAFPSTPAGGVYSISAVTIVPRFPGARRNSTDPQF